MSFLKNKVLFGIAFLILLNITFAFVQENQVGSYYAHNSILSPIKGVTVVAPPKRLNTKSLLPLANIQAEWVAFVPYGFSRKGNPSVSFNLDRQWWGERSEGIESSIITAREVGLKVMLKPQVYIGGGWVGDMDFESESDWKKWEENYAAYIKEFARIAAKHNVEMFCIGTEYNVAVKKRLSFWKQLIKDVRQTYKGQLIYSANWDNYQDVPFWDVMCSKLESELAELSKEDQKEMLESFGLKESGLAALAREAYRLLGMTVYYTAGPKEVRAWQIPIGCPAPEAAGVIHSDFEKGLIRAEVYSVDDLVQHKTEAAIRAAGKLRVEGKTYVFREGDVAHFLFNV